MKIIFRLLSSDEIACLNCRIGILNLFNPLEPDGAYELGISTHTFTHTHTQHPLTCIFHTIYFTACVCMQLRLYL